MSKLVEELRYHIDQAEKHGLVALAIHLTDWHDLIAHIEQAKPATDTDVGAKAQQPDIEDQLKEAGNERAFW